MATAAFGYRPHLRRNMRAELLKKLTSNCPAKGTHGLDLRLHRPVFALANRVLVRAAQYRARFNLKTPDALHLAAARCHGCEALWTHDNRLAQASRGLAQLVV